MNSLERLKMLMLALMNDDSPMQHHKTVITIETLTLAEAHRIWDIPDEAFKQLLESIRGHGGVSVDGKCSVCLAYSSKEVQIALNSGSLP